MGCRPTRGLIFRRGADYAAFSLSPVATRANVDERCDVLEASLAEVREASPS